MKIVYITLVMLAILTGGLLYMSRDTLFPQEVYLLPVPSPTPKLTTSQKIGTALDGLSTFSDLKKVSESSGVVQVSYYLDSDSDKKGTISEITSDCFTAQKTVWTSIKYLASVRVTITGPLSDGFGNITAGDLSICSLTLNTEARFNWSGLDADSAWKDYDFTWLLPDLRN